MKNKLTLAVSTALMSMSMHSAAELAEGVHASGIVASELTAVEAVSINKRQTAETHQPRFIAEKGLENKPYIYIVQLQDQSVAMYDGGVAGLSATNPQRNHKQLFNNAQAETKLNLKSRSVQAYSSYLENKQQSFLRSAQGVVSSVQPLSTYKYAFNGMSVLVTPDEAAKLAKLPGVIRIERDKLHQMHTDIGPKFIGADKIWDGSAHSGVGHQGEGMIVGILDSGINSDHPSFADIGGDGYDHTNPMGAGVYVGDCAADFPQMCNDKLIGVRSYPEITNVYADTNIFPADLPRNGEDYDGHGSHVASTAAGNVLKNVPVLLPEDGKLEGDGTPTGFVFDQISGVAPHANIIAYQVCMPGNTGDTYAGCSGAAILAAQEDAIKDGVHVANYSIGIPGPATNLAWASSEELGFLAMRNAGIFVATSAGNSGPNTGTTTKQAPWYTAVAMSTHGRSIEYKKELKDFSGGDSELATITGNSNSGGITASIVYAGDFTNSNDPDNPSSQCLQPFPAGTFSGQIVVCDRGSIARVAKAQNAEAGGAGGFVLANIDGGASSIANDVYVVPGIHIDNTQGNALKTWLASGSNHMATITGSDGELVFGRGDDLDRQSSRGPNITASTLSPFVAAPGVNIYAAYADQDYGNDVTATGPTDFNFLGGTSMASPHVAGSATLIKAVRTNWTPDNIRSALMMTASTDMRKDDGTTPADWFDMGAGRVQIDKAIESGLVMDETAANYQAANPSADGKPEELNLPSMTQNNCVGMCTFKRTVTATKDGSWTLAGVNISEGVKVTVAPETFDLTAGQEQEITVTVDAFEAQSDVWSFARLNLTSTSSPDLHMPIAIIASNGNVPSSASFNATRAQDSFLMKGIMAVEISEFTARSYGLSKAAQAVQSLPVDSNNSSPYDDLQDGIFVTMLEVPEGSKRLVAEVLKSASPDLDMFVGRDTNGDGIPQQDEQVASSATGTALEKVSLTNPDAGNYWVIVQNWSASAEGASDEFTLATAVVDGNLGDNLSVSTENSAIAQLTPFDIRFSWNIDGTEGDKYYGAVDLGTSSDKAGNLGTIAIDLNRDADDVQVSSNIEQGKRLNPGDEIDFTVSVSPNFTAEQRDYTVNVTVPAGLEMVANSNSAGEVTSNNTINWSVSQESLLGKEPSYDITTNATDARCVNPNFSDNNGAYIDLATLGINPDSSVRGNGITATYSVPASFLGQTSESIVVTDDGFISFGEIGSSPNANQLMPDSDTPNGVVAPYWRNMQFDPDNGATLSVAHTRNTGKWTLIEFDKMRTVYTVGGNPIEDEASFLVVFDNSPGESDPNIIFSYNGVNHSLGDQIPTSIGYENAAGTSGATPYYIPFFGSENEAVGSIAGSINDDLRICMYLKEVDSKPKTLTFKAKVAANNSGGATGVTVTSSLANTPGTVETSTGLATEVQVEGAPIALINGAPVFNTSSDENTSVSATGTAVDPNGDEVSISWTQVSGPTVSLSSTTSGQITITIPDVSGNSIARLQMTATEVATGKTSTAVLSINIRDHRDTGGSMGILSLLLLPLALWRRRLK